MSWLLSGIGNYIYDLLPNWLKPNPEVVPEGGPEGEPDRESDYETADEGDVKNDFESASAYTNIRWHSAIRRFLLWKKQGKNIEFYNGSTQWIGSENDFCDLSRDWFLIKANPNETLQEAHKRYNEEASAIAWRSKGQIDLRKTGTYAMASFRFFQDVSSAPRKAEDLSQEEDHWIRSAYTGALTWAEPYEGIATELDFNEFYPHILSSYMSGWPVRAGEFKTVTHIRTGFIKDHLKYGIYRAYIGGQPAEQKCIRGFRYNSAGYYTHYDLLTAMNLGLHIELSSESPNALIFEQDKLMSGHDIFDQWASYLTEIKKEGGQAGKVAKHMLVSLWGRLYSDGRRSGPHRRMAPFISAKGRKIISEKIKPLGDRVKRIHTDGFIISDKNTEQLLERYEGKGKLKVAKSGFVSIKNVMNIKWSDFEEIVPSSTKSGKSPIRYISLPNEILNRIFQYHEQNEGEKLHPLLIINKQWYFIARRLIWQKIVLTSISGVKFTKALSKDMKSDACVYVLSLKFIGEINIEPDVYISEVCKACPNLQHLSFENCGSRILNNKNLEALLIECSNLKSLIIRDSRRISPKTIIKIPKLTSNLEKVEIRKCFRIRKDIKNDFQKLYPRIKLIIEEEIDQVFLNL